VTVLPLSLALIPIFVSVLSDPVLLSCFPFANVLPTVGPFKCSVTLSLIIQEVTFVFLAVFPGKIASTMHFVFLPLAVVDLAIRPHILSLPVDLIVSKLSIVIRSVCEC